MCKVCMEFSWNPNSKCAEKPPIFYFNEPFFWCSLISKPTGWNQKIGKQCFLLKDTSFYISLNSLGFYVSGMLAEFSLTSMFQYVWEKLSIYGVHIPRKSLNLCLFIHDHFENQFPPRQKGWMKLWFVLSKFNQKIWRWIGTLVCFHLVWL